MLVEIAHLTRFTYERPVVLEPLTVRLRPRSDLFQRLVSFDLVADPAPEGTTALVDVEGNAVASLWFLGTAGTLTIRTTATVETLQPNPFDYIVLDSDRFRLPMGYSPAEHRALERYLDAAADPALAVFATSVLEYSGGGPTAFLGELCARIARTIAHELRSRGGPMPAGETLARGAGACRDRAVLFIEACRWAGIAARFVSGYEVGGGEFGRDGAYDLHAWAEVYLSGAGWRGYDPSQGLAVADWHVAVAAGPSPAEAAPTAGTFLGAGVGSHLETAITVRVPAMRPAIVRPA